MLDTGTQSHYYSYPHQSNHGFSLMELLVVMLIITVLVSILLPSLSAVKDRSRAAACLSNSRQIVTAMLAYSADGDGRMVAYRTPYENNAHLVWDVDAVQDQNSGGADEFGDWWTSRLYRQNYLNVTSMFECPSLESTTDLSDSLDSLLKSGISDEEIYSDHAWNKSQYGYNVRFLGSMQGWQYPGQLPATREELARTPRVSDIKKPSQTIVISDSKNRAIETNEAFWLNDPDVDGPRIEGIGYLFPTYDPPEIQFGYAHARHKGNINVGWADGHVDQIKTDNPDNPYTVDSLTSVADTPVNNFWDLN